MNTCGWRVEVGATLLFMVPSMYQMLAEHPGFAAADFSRVRWAICGGAPCPPSVRAPYEARGIRFKQGYGMTEAGVNCFMFDLEEAARYPDSVGRPLVGTEAMIARADGTACGVDQVGELLLRGPHVFQGYFRKPQETGEALSDGWLRTGDLARRDAGGRHYICGRRKEMYISGGENVYPAEVEAVLSSVEGVAECAVLGVPDARWGETGLAAVVLRSNAHWDAGEPARRAQETPGRLQGAEPVFVSGNVAEERRRENTQAADIGALAEAKRIGNHRLNRHPGESRGPELERGTEFPGFRLAPE